MEKVKVSKEEAEAIREALEDYNPVEIISLHVQRNLARLNGMDRDTLIKALYIGYEVEQTPEDKVRALYQLTLDEANDLDDHPQADWWRSRRKAIIETLNALNINIEGVND